MTPDPIFLCNDAPDEKGHQQPHWQCGNCLRFNAPDIATCVCQDDPDCSPFFRE